MYACFEEMQGRALEIVINAFSCIPQLFASRHVEGLSMTALQAGVVVFCGIICRLRGSSSQA